MMNRFVRLILLAAATLAIAACGEQKAPEPAPAAEVTSEPALAPDVINIPPAGVATKLTGKWQSTEDAAPSSPSPLIPGPTNTPAMTA
ncbi:MAG: hypothetical protein IPO30_11125 [Hyphomonadaceae bacterium]|nr:hypothetical protein [Hyphomonadaceae bacterium]